MSPLLAGLLEAPGDSRARNAHEAETAVRLGDERPGLRGFIMMFGPKYSMFEALDPLRD